ncbi:unnamed protein product [Nyctereutes procyonoides]|uniref:(raccoon dog) hypothetical protein n=1 Tax=Nyctereutes procyonoides TaxID=34880 RepID=A0A811YP92_NYCPR|nr:unnamed protein product [Nyctereutes procyonoides]CAD7688163.1 unnamed protein product [Nyctereutes procyonoides]
MESERPWRPSPQQGVSSRLARRSHFPSGPGVTVPTRLGPEVSETSGQTEHLHPGAPPYASPAPPQHPCGRAGCPRRSFTSLWGTPSPAGVAVLSPPAARLSPSGCESVSPGGDTQGPCLPRRPPLLPRTQLARVAGRGAVGSSLPAGRPQHCPQPPGPRGRLFVGLAPPSSPRTRTRGGCGQGGSGRMESPGAPRAAPPHLHPRPSGGNTGSSKDTCGLHWPQGASKDARRPCAPVCACPRVALRLGWAPGVGAGDGAAPGPPTAAALQPTGAPPRSLHSCGFLALPRCCLLGPRAAEDRGQGLAAAAPSNPGCSPESQAHALSLIFGNPPRCAGGPRPTLLAAQARGGLLPRHPPGAPHRTAPRASCLHHCRLPRPRHLCPAEAPKVLPSEPTQRCTGPEAPANALSRDRTPPWLPDRAASLFTTVQLGRGLFPLYFPQPRAKYQL